MPARVLLQSAAFSLVLALLSVVRMCAAHNGWKAPLPCRNALRKWRPSATRQRRRKPRAPRLRCGLLKHGLPSCNVIWRSNARRLSGCAPNARKTQPQRPKVPGCNRNWMRWNGSAAPQQRAPAGHRLIRCKASNAARANWMLLCSALGGFEPDAGLKPVLALMAIRGRP